MGPNTKLISSAITAGVIAGGGALAASMANGGELTANVLVASLITALVAAAKDWRTFLAKSPKE